MKCLVKHITNMKYLLGQIHNGGKVTSAVSESIRHRENEKWQNRHGVREQNIIQKQNKGEKGLEMGPTD